MHRNTLAALAVAGLGLCGCNPRPVADVGQGDHHGRYTGVGIYAPREQWTKLLAAQQATDPKVAQLIDDQVIIVVQDSATGEVRACGDLTGYCIGMNPWKTALLSAQIAPVKLTEHQPPGTSDAKVELTAKPAEPDKPSHGPT
jgi:hypothetical protein